MNRLAITRPFALIMLFFMALVLAQPQALARAEPRRQDPTETPEPAGFARPLLVLTSYSGGSLKLGQEFTLHFRLENAGQSKARNIIAAFVPGDLIPRANGGVVAAGVISPGASTGYEQKLAVAGSTAPGTASLLLNLSYTDDDGTGYAETFTLTFFIEAAAPSYAGPAPSPTPVTRPQLLIRSYATSVDVLTPGTRFTLRLEIINAGAEQAQGVTLILGGGGSSGGSESQAGTGSPGGLSGASGDFTNFAPVGSSNVQSLGVLAPGAQLQASQELIVNSTTQPGAYPLKLSFDYLDQKGQTFNDDQVITLLVFSPPQVEVSFYRPPDPLMVGFPGSLPIQVVNLDRNPVLLGRMQVTAGTSQIENGISLIGYLDSGGYFTLDPLVFPEVEGDMTLRVVIDYLDDFNQPMQLVRELSVNVQPAGQGGAGEGGLPPEGGSPGPSTDEPETWWQKLVRIVRGLLGLDSGAPLPAPGEAPLESPPSEAPQVAPVGPKG
jgi:hypothetical protein